MQTPAENTTKKLNVGWFTFTCSEDSTILLTELLNDNFDKWKPLVDFKYFKALKSNNSYENLDVAFIEGAISAEKQAEEAKKIRANAKYVVAIGACACTGHPSSTRNKFTSEQLNDRIKWFMKQFAYNQNVKKLSDVIKVDDMVNGCPMNVPAFLAVLEKYLKICTQAK